MTRTCLKVSSSRIAQTCNHLNVCLQVHYDTWRHPADAQNRRSGSQTASLAYRLLPQSLQDAYADGVARLTQPTNGQVSSNPHLMTNACV